MLKKTNYLILLFFLFSLLWNDKVVYANDLVTNVIDISGGYGHTIVLKSDGTVWTWGKNLQGQLGNDTTRDSLTPVRVTTLTNIEEIAAGHNYSIALENNGSVWTWGLNNSGQFLGDGTEIDRYLPVKVLTNVQHITKTKFHCIALKNDGTVWVWGDNDWGQLGDGTTIDKLTPVQVTGLTNIEEIAAGGDHSIALKNDGTVWTWGYNSDGQLGDGTTMDKLTPVQVNGLTNIKEIAAGIKHTIALQNDGTVWAWGDNFFGQLGDGTEIDRLTPVQVTGLTNIKEIVAGSNHSIALKKDGTIYTWGLNNDGQLGNGKKSIRKTPNKIKNLKNIKTIAAGYDHSMALQNDGTVWAWGLNNYGQLGNQKKGNELKPVKVLGLDLPKPVDIHIFLNSTLPSKNIQFRIMLVMDDGSTRDITIDDNTVYNTSNSEVALINNRGYVSLVHNTDQDDFSITVSYKHLNASTVYYHVRDTLVGEKLIYGNDDKGIYRINQISTYSKDIPDSVFNSIRNIILSPFPGAGEALNLIEAIKAMNDVKWKDINLIIKVPTFAIGDSFALSDGNNYNNYSSFYWTSIEIDNKDKTTTFHYLLEGGGKIIYIISEKDKLTINNCMGDYIEEANILKRYTLDQKCCLQRVIN